MPDIYKQSITCDYLKTNLHIIQNPIPVHNHFTRNRQFRPDRHRRTIYENSFMYNAPRFYSNLPPRLKVLRNPRKFKRELKNHLLSLY